jgi:hypothetical protein
VPNYYDVTIITVRPGMHPQASPALSDHLAGSPDLLACWYSEIGALNQILIIKTISDPAANLAAHAAAVASRNPFGIGDLISDMSMDTYTAFDFLPPMRPGELGPCYEVRTYMLKPNGLPPTFELWREWAPRRAKVSPLLVAMTSLTGPVLRFMHIWPYKTLDERARLRAKAVTDGVWPPPSGPGHLAMQQSDVYLPFDFSPLR